MYRRLLLLAFTIVGVTSVVTQTLFIRELEQIFFGNELCLGVIFAGWLFFTGIGSIIGRKIKKNIFLELQVSLAIILPLEFLLIHFIKPVLRIGPGELISPISMISLSFTILAPISLVLGLEFVQGCKWWAVETKNSVQGVARVYILDALGDMVGGFIFACLLVRLFSLNSLFIIAILNLIIAFVLLTCLKQTDKYWRSYLLRGVIVAFSVICIVGISLSGKIERFSIKHNYPGYEIVDHKRSIYGTIVLVKRGSLFSVYQSGMLGFTYPDPLNAEETVHFPFLQVKDPRRVLLLGGSVELISEVLKYPINEVCWVTLDPNVIEICKRSCLKPWINFPLEVAPLEVAPQIDCRGEVASSVHVIYGDERGFVKKYGGEKNKASPNEASFFDLAIIALGDPHNSLINRFYTVEFFKELRNILHKEGVVALSIGSNLDYLSPELKEYNSIIYHTLKKVFPNVALLPGERLMLFGSESSDWLTEDPNILAARVNVPTRYVTKFYIPYKFYPERISYIKETLSKSTPRSLNTDFHPISYYYNMTVTTSYFSQWFEKGFTFLSKIPFRVIIIAVIVMVIALGFIVRGPVLGIGILGATGIGAQLSLIFAFEVLYGYMYHRIGIITGVFMFGLAIGARFTEKKNSTHQLINSSTHKLATIVGWTILYLGSLLLIIKGLSYRTLSIFEPIFYVLPVIGGILVGSAWIVANQILIKQGESAERSSGLLNGIDLFGSCVGSFFLSIFFIPIYGLCNSIILLALLNFMTLIFLLKHRV